MFLETVRAEGLSHLSYIIGTGDALRSSIRDVKIGTVSHT
jgi:hypothetical protein